jgi:hypothetical protein
MGGGPGRASPAGHPSQPCIAACRAAPARERPATTHGARAGGARRCGGSSSIFACGCAGRRGVRVLLFARPGVGAVTLALPFGLFSLFYGISRITLGVQLRQRRPAQPPSALKTAA